MPLGLRDPHLHLRSQRKIGDCEQSTTSLKAWLALKRCSHITRQLARQRCQEKSQTLTIISILFKVPRNSFPHFSRRRLCILLMVVTVLIIIRKKWGSPSSFLSYRSLSLKLREFLTGHIVAMVTCYISRITTTCIPMIGHLYDYIIVASFVKPW